MQINLGNWWAILQSLFFQFCPVCPQGLTSRLLKYNSHPVADILPAAFIQFVSNHENVTLQNITSFCLLWQNFIFVFFFFLFFCWGFIMRLFVICMTGLWPRDSSGNGRKEFRVPVIKKCPAHLLINFPITPYYH